MYLFLSLVILVMYVNPKFPLVYSFLIPSNLIKKHVPILMFLFLQLSKSLKRIKYKMYKHDL